MIAKSLYFKNAGFFVVIDAECTLDKTVNMMLYFSYAQKADLGA